MKSLLIVFLFSITTVLYTQNLQQAISGEVKDSNGEFLVGATITIDPNLRGTTTNFDGKYVFKKNPIGKYTVTASFVGFITKTKEILVTKSKNVVLNFTLKEKNEVLNEVAIKGTTKKTKQETKGYLTNVIETKEASVRNIQTNELLNTTAGVKIRQNGGLGSHVEYSLNGLSGSSISIFIDGIPISMYGSSFSLNSIPASLIEKIEIYKGVVPGHLADDTLGGVINIVMKKGSKNNLNASVSYGSFNTFQSSINGLYRYKKSGFTVKASAFYNYSDNDYKVWGGNVKHIEVDGSETPITAKRFNDAYKSTGAMVQVGFTNVNWADQFLVGVNTSDDYNEVQHGAFMTKHPYKGRFLESDALLTNLIYQKKDYAIKGLDININALIGIRNTFVNDTVPYAYTWLGVRQQRPVDFTDPYGATMDLENSWGSQQEGGPTLFNINRKVSSIRSGISYKINKQHKVLLNHFFSGLDREDSDKILPLLENTFKQTSDLYKNIYSLSYELNAFRKKLKVNLFGKHYQQKVVNTSPEFNEDETEVIDIIYKANKNYNGYGGTLSYAITPNIILLASTEKAIRMPNETEVFGDTGENVIANLSIKPEISYNYNLGFRLGTFAIKKHDITVSSSLFSRNIQDLIGFPSTDDDDELVQYENFDNQTTSRGIEGQLNYTYNNNFGFNFNISKLTLKTANSFGMIVDIPNTPLFTMNGSLRYSIKNFIQKKSHLNFFYNAYFTDEFSSIMQRFANNAGLDKYIIPTQFVQDLGCSYTFPKQKIVLSLDAKNIFNKQAFDNRSVQKAGRAFYLKLNYTINKL